MRKALLAAAVIGALSAPAMSVQPATNSDAIRLAIEATYKFDAATALEHVQTLDTSDFTPAQRQSRANAITALQQPNYGEARAWLGLI